MRILLTGAGGQLGMALQGQGRKSAFEIIPAVHAELDIGAAEAVADAMERFDPDLVVNAAAYTDVDKAESQPEEAYRVNEEAPAVLAGACARAGAVLIHVSSDYVFDGRKGRPYVESDPIAPESVYARSKAGGEQRIRAVLPAHIILRTSWLYGVYGRNFVKTMLRIGRERKVLQVVDDQFGSPTNAGDLARIILQIAAAVGAGSGIVWGTYHYGGRGIVSRHRFAETIFELAEAAHFFKRPLVEAVSTARYPTPAKRPPFSALDCSRIHRNFGIAAVPWQQSLALVIRELAVRAGAGTGAPAER